MSATRLESRARASLERGGPRSRLWLAESIPAASSLSSARAEMKIALAVIAACARRSRSAKTRAKHHFPERTFVNLTVGRPVLGCRVSGPDIFMAGSEFTSELFFSVRDWFAWAPGRETRPAWRGWASGVASDAESSGERAAPMPSVPMMLRRRATPIGQRAVGAALACQDVAAARYVIASRHGEYDRTVGIFTALAAGEAPSPAEFSMSVHHGLAGLLSIHTGNRLGHVAVAAAEDSFGSGMLEAALCLAEEPATPVMLIYYDAPLPGDYERFRCQSEAELPLVLALLLGAAPDARITYQWEPVETVTKVTESQALVFLRWLLSGAPRAECRGGRLIWRWSRAH
jgi:Beta-ketoacyl synthase, N-terminal domain